MAQQQNEEILKWLRQRGHSTTEIEKILAKLSAYDQAVVRDALFDSINSGTFDIDTIIREALQADRMGES